MSGTARLGHDFRANIVSEPFALMDAGAVCRMPEPQLDRISSSLLAVVGGATGFVGLFEAGALFLEAGTAAIAQAYLPVPSTVVSSVLLLLACVRLALVPLLYLAAIYGDSGRPAGEGWIATAVGGIFLGVLFLEPMAVMLVSPSSAATGATSGLFYFLSLVYAGLGVTVLVARWTGVAARKQALLRTRVRFMPAPLKPVAAAQIARPSARPVTRPVAIPKPVKAEPVKPEPVKAEPVSTMTPGPVSPPMSGPTSPMVGEVSTKPRLDLAARRALREQRLQQTRQPASQWDGIAQAREGLESLVNLRP